MSEYKRERKRLKAKMRFAEQTLLGVSLEIENADKALRETDEWRHLDQLGAQWDIARTVFAEARLEFLQSKQPPMLIPSCESELSFEMNVHFCGKESGHSGFHSCGHHVGTLTHCELTWAR